MQLDPKIVRLDDVLKSMQLDWDIYCSALEELYSRSLSKPNPQIELTSEGGTIAELCFAYIGSFRLPIAAMYRLRFNEPELVEVDAAICSLGDIIYGCAENHQWKPVEEKAKELGVSNYAMVFLGGIYFLQKGIGEGYVQMLEEGKLIGFLPKLHEIS